MTKPSPSVRVVLGTLAKLARLRDLDELAHDIEAFVAQVPIGIVDVDEPEQRQWMLALFRRLDADIPGWQAKMAILESFVEEGREEVRARVRAVQARAREEAARG